MTAPLRVGVVGLGVISRFYLAALRDSSSMELVAVCDRDPVKAASCPVPVYTDHVRLLDEERPDALVVTVPNDVHLSVCADALERDVAVCVEKPLALDVAQGAALRRLADRRGVPLFTAFHRRYNAAVARLREECAGSRITEVTVRYLERIEEHAGDDGWYLDPERCGGGCVADNGPNAFDLLNLLLGPAEAAPEVVRARIGRDARGTDRRADVRLRSRTAAARILLDWSYPGELKDVEVHLADGRTLHADMLAGHAGFKGSLWHEYVGVLRDFERCVRDPGRPDGGLAALRFVRAAYHLAEPRRGRRCAPAAAGPPGTAAGGDARTGGAG
ncbi:Gfo/Idh/MocA family protein [Actinomadura verrucosospora]|uniref:Oxidoreductase, NAD-binding Rossmann fold family protein n=1 Tax=Actinomadura verrucosospora TaxID=46165 RepID=A0A7D3VS99_ACTVE|nr:Gfo/Idh/MocA family oxidoreductase [Actinomadura verrucosospora]QKG21239.1 oxidoreductase, NAD-binding Rossmann fold family protein [Actinomadura verrucosospora]